MAYAGDLQTRLLQGGGQELTVAERVGVLADVQALAKLGRIPIEEELALVPAFSKDPNRHVVTTLVEIADSIDDHLVPDVLRGNYERLVRDAFGATARRLSWKPAAGEGTDEQLLRPRVLGIVAGAGRDAELRREGAGLGRRWLDDRSAAAPSVAGITVMLAAREGDAGLFKRMAAEARQARENRDRDRIFRALGCFLDPALERRALALVLDPSLDVRDSIHIFWAALGDRRTRDVAWEFFRGNYDAIAARLPREYLPLLPYAGQSFCDAERREEVRAFFEPRIGKVEGAARPLAQALESIGRCSALAASQRAGVERFLRSYRPGE